MNPEEKLVEEMVKMDVDQCALAVESMIRLQEESELPLTPTKHEVFCDLAATGRRSKMIQGIFLSAVANKGKKELWVRCGACEHIVAAMRIFGNDLDIQDFACEAAYAMADTEEGASRLVSGGVVELLCRMMKTWPGDKAIQPRACSLMRMLAESDVGRERLLSQTDVIKLLLKTMKAEVHLEVAQDVCMATLVSLADCDKGLKAVVKAGAAPAAVRAMATHRDSAVVLAKACLLLGRMACLTGSARPVLDRQGCELVCHAMKTFPDDDYLQRQALWALMLAVHVEELRVHAVPAGVCRWTCRALDTYHADEVMQGRGFDVIATLSHGTVSLRPMVDAGGCESVCRGMAKFHTSEPIQHRGVFALSGLVKDHEGRLRIVNAGGCELVYEVMDKYSKTPTQQHICAAVLTDLARAPAGLEKLVRVKACNSVLRVMWVSPGLCALQEQGSELLILFAQSVEGRGQLYDAGVCGFLAYHLETFDAPAQHVMRCFKVLCALAEDAAGVSHLFEARSLAAVCASMTKHKREKDVQQMGRALVVKLRAMDAMDKRHKRHQKGGESGQGPSVRQDGGGVTDRLSTGGGDTAQPIETDAPSESAAYADFAAAARHGGGLHNDETHKKVLETLRHESFGRQIDEGLMEQVCGTSQVFRAWHIVKLEDAFKARWLKTDAGERLLCPLSLQPMVNAVVAADGITYSEQALLNWFDEARLDGVDLRSPVTGCRMRPTMRKNPMIRDILSLAENLAADE